MDATNFAPLSLDQPPRRPARPPTVAAIDLDGTLLGPDRRISPANAYAVAALQSAGLAVVLASGRHYHAMTAYAHALPGVRWLISSQGGEVGDLARSAVLGRSYLAPADAAAAIRLGMALGVALIGNGATDIYAHGADLAAMIYDAGLPPGMEPVLCTPAAMLGQQLKKVPLFRVGWVPSRQARPNGEATRRSSFPAIR
jgi:hypothetical protein